MEGRGRGLSLALGMLLIHGMFYQALHAASRAGNAIEVERIISQGVNPNRASSNGTTPLMIAALNNRRSVIEVLISSGCNVDAQNPDGATALWLAAEMGNADIVEYIAAKGGTVDALDKKGMRQDSVAGNSHLNRFL